MKIAVCVVLIAALLGHCFPFRQTFAVKTLEYQLGDDQFAVVVIQDEEIKSTSQAKQYARERAAKIAVENGYRYFVVESERETKVVKSDRSLSDTEAFYGNMYQEMIIEGDFGKGSLARQAPPSEGIYRGIRLVFKCFVQKPNWKAVDACSLTEC